MLKTPIMLGFIQFSSHPNVVLRIKHRNGKSLVVKAVHTLPAEASDASRCGFLEEHIAKMVLARVSQLDQDRCCNSDYSL